MCPLEAQHAWKLAKAGPAPALRSPHPHHPSTLCRKKALDSFRRDPRSGLALVWRRELDLMGPHGAWGGKLSSFRPPGSSMQGRDVDERGEDRRIIGGKITISERIEGV